MAVRGGWSLLVCWGGKGVWIAWGSLRWSGDGVVHRLGVFVGGVSGVEACDGESGEGGGEVVG